MPRQSFVQRTTAFPLKLVNFFICLVFTAGFCPCVLASTAEQNRPCHPNKTLLSQGTGSAFEYTPSWDNWEFWCSHLTITLLIMAQQLQHMLWATYDTQSNQLFMTQGFGQQLASPSAAKITAEWASQLWLLVPYSFPIPLNHYEDLRMLFNQGFICYGRLTNLNQRQRIGVRLRATSI